MASILITGGTGFIGSHIVECLLSEGHQITILTSSSSIHSNIRPFKDQINLVYGNFGNRELLIQVLKDIQYIIHGAWTTVPKTSTENPVYDAQSNIIGSIQLLEAAHMAGVKKVIFISTGGAIYGIPEYTPIDERHPVKPISAYGISKMAFERYLHFYHKNKQLDYLILRISNVYGPRQNLINQQGVIGIWLKKIRDNQPIEVWGDGSVIRDYIYVSDIALAIQKTINYSGLRRVFNLGSGVGYSLNQILDICKKVSRKEPQIHYKEARRFDVPTNILSIEKSKQEFDWTPKVQLEDGIQKTWDWISRL